MNIVKDRLPVLIGKRGETKRRIEKSTDTKINIGDYITIEGDILGMLTAENIIKAIGRGFSPRIAFNLLDEEKELQIIKLPVNKSALLRIRSRLIGTEGKARRNIERLTHTKISVYGKTVSIIGNYDDVRKAESAVEKLIIGWRHKSAYKGLH